MDNNKFEKLVKKVVAEHHNRSNDPGLSQITEEDYGGEVIKKLKERISK